MDGAQYKATGGKTGIQEDNKPEHATRSGMERCSQVCVYYTLMHLYRVYLYIHTFVVYGTTRTFRLFVGKHLSLHLLDTKPMSNIFILPGENKSHFNNSDLISENSCIQYITFYSFMRQCYRMVVHGDKLGL